MKNTKILLIIIALFTGITFTCIGCVINGEKLDSNEVSGAVHESTTAESMPENRNDTAVVEKNTLEKIDSGEASPTFSKHKQSKNINTKQSSDQDASRSVALQALDKKEIKLPLEGLTICIDAGHGKTTKATNLKEPIAPGSDIMKAAVATGTSGVSTKITEASLNLTVSKKLKKALSDKGANIIMIRESDNCNLTNVERTKLWNSSGADLTIRIHANGINDSSVSGVLMMVPGDKYIKNREMIDESTLVGQYILNGVLKYTKAKSRGTVISNELTGFNWSKIPVVLLEMGFMTNPKEDKLLNTDSYQDKIVKGVVEGIEKYQSSINIKIK